MKDQDKTKAELIEELKAIRKLVSEVEKNKSNHKLTEKALEFSEERFKHFTENAQDMLYRMSIPDGKYEYVSQASISVFGYTQDEFYNNPKLIQKAIHPDWKEYFEKEWTNLTLGRMPKTYEYQIIDKSGETKWVHQRNVLIHNDDGKPIAIEGIVTDITNRKKVEEELYKSEYLLKKALNIAKMGYWELDIINNKLVWSDEIYRIFNITLEQFDATYEAFLNNIHPDDRDLVNRAYTNSLKEKTPYSITHRLQLEDGTVKYVEEKCTTEFDKKGKPLKSIGTIKDITKQKLIEIELKGNEEKFREYTNQASDGITVADLEGNYVFINPAFCKMSGYTEEELLSMTVFDMKAKDQNYESFFDSKKGKEGIPIEVKLKRKDGTEYLTEIIGKVITIGNNKFVLGTIQDITKRKRAEDELKGRNRELEIFNDVTVDREFRIIELKKEINELIERTGEKPKYEIPV